METRKVIISPKTKIGELLECYPHLEEVMIEMSPAFGKLKNPVLRKTVARVATLAQVAVVGGLKVEDIINRLRKETGEEAEVTAADKTDYITTEYPSWYNKLNLKVVYDATQTINAGESPMGDVLSKAHSLDGDEIMELQTPFVPAPIIDLLREKGFITFTTSESGLFTTGIRKVQAK